MFENEIMGENVEEVAQPQEMGTDFETQNDESGDLQASPDGFVQNDSGAEPVKQVQSAEENSNLNDMVSNHPDVLAARKLAAKSREENARLYVERELAEVKKFDAGINTFEDLRSLEKFPEIERLLMNNYSISDAYKLANFDAISKRGAEAAAQSVRNSAESKSHLKPHGGGSGDAIVVPEEVKEQYRFFNKGITDEEIAKDYAKSMKRKI